jgi:hypothetical protein
MSELFETTERERELYAAVLAAGKKCDQAAIDLGRAIELHNYKGSRTPQENEARKALLKAIEEKRATSRMWVQTHDALKALKAANAPEAA